MHAAFRSSTSGKFIDIKRCEKIYCRLILLQNEIESGKVIKSWMFHIFSSNCYLCGFFLRTEICLVPINGSFFRIFWFSVSHKHIWSSFFSRAGSFPTIYNWRLEGKAVHFEFSQGFPQNDVTCNFPAWFFAASLDVYWKRLKWSLENDDSIKPSIDALALHCFGNEPHILCLLLAPPGCEQIFFILNIRSD